MSHETTELRQPHENEAGIAEAPPAGGAESKLVPVAESIKYRRRAQQAEERLQQIEQQLTELQSQLEHRSEEIAQAEAQRDEANQHLVNVQNRMLAERMMSQAGVVDIEAASLLLGKRMDLNEELEPEAISLKVEQLLLDKPFLRSPLSPPLPPTTASPKVRPNPAAMLAQAAQRAARSGGRRDVAEYLRLRRQSAASNRPAGR